jgi:hypothetical protein
MAFMNKAERDALLDRIKDKRFNRIKGILRGVDRKIKLAYYRNIQEVGRWMTRYVLPTYGVQVTLVENQAVKGFKAEYELVEIIVEPTADNRL